MTAQSPARTPALLKSKSSQALTAVVVLGLSTALLPGCGAPEIEGGEAVNPSYFEPTSMPACNTALATWDGTTAYSNGSDTGTGNSCAGTGSYGYKYQCVELVMRHFTTKWGLRWYGNAKDLLNNAPRASVDVYTNGDSAHPPVPGDMLVWTNGTYGHVALITGVRSGAVDIIEQNVTGNGKATLGYNGSSIATRWGSWTPAGWAHAKANRGGGGTGGWSCASSDYMGRQVYTCNGNARSKCHAGTPTTDACERGCFSAGVGRDDLCISSSPGWNCANSAAGGQQWWTCSGGNLYRCDGTSPTIVRCPSGCNVGAVGTNDTCK